MFVVMRTAIELLWQICTDQQIQLSFVTNYIQRKRTTRITDINRSTTNQVDILTSFLFSEQNLDVKTQQPWSSQPTNNNCLKYSKVQRIRPLRRASQSYVCPLRTLRVLPSCSTHHMFLYKQNAFFIFRPIKELCSLRRITHTSYSTQILFVAFEGENEVRGQCRRRQLRHHLLFVMVNSCFYYLCT